MMMTSMNALFYVASTTPLGDSGVTSNTALFVPQWDDVDIAPNDVVCFVGSAMSLEPDLESVHGGGGSDCTAGNGCGVHIHAGTGCGDKAAQGKCDPCVILLISIFRRNYPILIFNRNAHPNFVYLP